MGASQSSVDIRDCVVRLVSEPVDDSDDEFWSAFLSIQVLAVNISEDAWFESASSNKPCFLLYPLYLTFSYLVSVFFSTYALNAHRGPYTPAFLA